MHTYGKLFQLIKCNVSNVVLSKYLNTAAREIGSLHWDSQKLFIPLQIGVE